MHRTNRININTLAPFIQHLLFFALVIGGDIAILMLDINLETGGAKLILPNYKWAMEFNALFALVGIQPEYLTPAHAAGYAITIATFVGTFVSTHFWFQICCNLSVVSQHIKSLLNRGEHAENHVDTAKAASVMQSIVISSVIGILTFLYLFPNWTLPLAQLQISHKIWPEDFEVAPKGDSIAAVKQTMPDMNTVLEKHTGEFSKAVVTKFPIAVLVLHILFGFLTEVLFLQCVMYAGQMEARVAGVTHNINMGILVNPYRRIKRAMSNDYGQPVYQPASHTPSPEVPTETHNTDVPVATHPTPAAEADAGGMQTNGDEDETLPEDRAVRVLGDTVFLTPRDAEDYPDLYVVERNGKNNGSRSSTYTIYTKEYYDEFKKVHSN